MDGCLYKCILTFVFVWGSSLFLSAQQKMLKEGYYPNGKLRYQGYFVNNEPVGKVTHYDVEGNVKAIMDHQGEMTEAVLFSKNKVYTTCGKYYKRRKTGEWKYWKGKRLLAQEDYKNNLLDGISVRYFETGDTAEIKNWNQGKLEGKWKLFYSNGHLRMEAFFKGGKLDGSMKSYHYEGGVAAEGIYKNNLKEGRWSFYDESGKKTGEKVYHGGVAEGIEAEELEVSRRLDSLIDSGIKIPDPAVFMDEPERYMKLTGE